MVASISACCTWRRVCTLCRLSRLLFFFPLLVSTASIHDSVPPPMFLPGASVVTARQGDVAVLPCAVRHLGTKQVAWRRIDADDFLTIGEMTWIGDDKIAVEHTMREHDASDWNLVIDKVTLDDAGVYECQVTSKHGFNKLVKLNVVGPPIKEAVISIAGKRYVDLGEKIHLVCNASGGPRIPEDIDWFKDGDMIDSFKYPHVLIEKYQSIRDRAFISELVIDHAKDKDSGEYVCRSSRNNIVNMKITVLKETKPPDTKRRDHGSVPESVSGSRSGCPQLRNYHSLHVQLVLLSATYFLLTWAFRS